MKTHRTPFERQLATAIANLERGEVVSFGDIAARAGRPKASRAAGRMLSTVVDTELPWWRVVYSSGKLPPCNPVLQSARLADEGVDVENNRVTRAPLGRFEA